MTLSTNIIGFHHYAIKAQDFEQTTAFYQTLGFEILHEWSLPNFNLKRCAMLYQPSIAVHLEICDKDADMPTQGRKRSADDDITENALLHICFIVQDAEQARLAAIDAGAKDLSKGTSHLDLIAKNKKVSVTNSLVFSPNGEVIEFLEAVDFRGHRD
ncbi:VOC family protein [Sphingobacterium sp. LRF_L2]|uniref:VOC family protein n=1 Tax=Sphingobacterium sp. LRF_L2 TaxID=3369421 RepID=UPI003F62D2F0